MKTLVISQFSSLSEEFLKGSLMSHSFLCHRGSTRYTGLGTLSKSRENAVMGEYLQYWLFSWSHRIVTAWNVIRAFSSLIPLKCSLKKESLKVQLIPSCNGLGLFFFFKVNKHQKLLATHGFAEELSHTQTSLLLPTNLKSFMFLWLHHLPDLQLSEGSSDVRPSSSDPAQFTITEGAWDTGRCP